MSRLIVVLVVALTLSACSAFGTTGPRLVVPDVPFGMTINRTAANKPYTFLFVQVCLDEPGRVMIEDVEIFDPRNLTLDAFATRPKTTSTNPGSGTRPLERTAGFEEMNTTVRSICPNQYHFLGIELSRHGGGTGFGRALDVTYRSGEELREERIWFRMILCAPGDTTVPRCPKH